MQTMSPDVVFADDLDQGSKMAGSTPQNETSTHRSNKLYALAIAVACGFLLAALLPTAPTLGEEKDVPVLLQQELANSVRMLQNNDGSDTDNSVPATNMFGFVGQGPGCVYPNWT
jgi:hypothetical protein